MDKMLSECKLQDILAVTMVKDHLDTLTKDADAKRVAAEEQVKTLTTKVQGLEASDAAQKTEITDLKAKLQVFDTQRVNSKIAHLVDAMVSLKKPAAKAIVEEKDDKKKGELRTALIADYQKKSEAVLDELISLVDAEIPKPEDQGAVKQMVNGEAGNRDSRTQAAQAKGISLTDILDKK